jgi:phage-related protein
MPFAGLIMPKPGMSTMDNTVENFSYCIKQDASMVFNIAMLPFEFALYLVIEFMDTVLEAIMAVIKLIQWLKDQIGGIVEKLYNQLLYFIIPLIEIIIHVRDGLSKVNGIALTTLFVTMSVYELTVSGVINIMNILADLLIALISVIVALMVVAFVLLVTPAFPVGITMYATGTAVLVSILIPTIVLYVLMHTFTKAVMDQSAADSPSPPNVKKRR